MAFLALQPDVGLQCIFLCGARTAAPHKLFRTQFRTHLNFWVIAPTPALALFIIIFLYISYFLHNSADPKKDFQMCTKAGKDILMSGSCHIRSVEIVVEL